MPSTPVAQQPQPSANTSYGQVIEYCPGKLYLASYTHAPNDKTPFPYPNKSSSPSKRSARTQLAGVSSRTTAQKQPIYFSVDGDLLYNAFHLDFGPLHIGHLYRFAVAFHDVIGDPDHLERPVVFWSKADSRSRANAACLLACYMVMIQNWPPHLALAPIAQMDPPPMPFRDAGYSQADYVLTIQDIVYGIWRAKEAGLVDLKEFDLREYEQFERVDEGDFNWLTPDFLAFASPQTESKDPKEPIESSHPQYRAIPRRVDDVKKATHLRKPFRNVLTHFHNRNVGLVVRLNSKLYSSSYFTALGIQHLDMIFDDGTCPNLDIVRKFINLSHEMITVKKKGIAVHCKAGLGRTGCLIGAYLIYRYGFTANEIIAFMRFMRPGMVVGPQQHWLHITQGTFREWWFEDTFKARYAQSAPLTPTRGKSARLASNGQTFTPPNGAQKRAALGEIASNDQSSMAHMGAGVGDEHLPAPTPGQPRKTSKAYGGNLRSRDNDAFNIHPDTEVVTIQRHTKDGSESEEEFQMRMLARRASSRSPNAANSTLSSSKRRAVSCTSTTVTTTEWSYPHNENSDAENDETPMSISPKPRTPSERKLSGKGEISVSKVRASSPLRKVSDGTGKTPAGIRKTSSRIGSLNGAVAASTKAR